MKDKQLLKLLKAEVTSMMPNVYDAAKSAKVTPDKNRELNLKVNAQPTRKAKFTLAFACCMVAVFTLMACMPLIIGNRVGTTNNVYQTEQSQSSDKND